VDTVFQGLRKRRRGEKTPSRRGRQGITKEGDWHIQPDSGKGGRPLYADKGPLKKRPKGEELTRKKRPALQPRGSVTVHGSNEGCKRLFFK